MADYRNEAKDCDLNVLDDILDNTDDHGYIDDEDEKAEEVSKVYPKKQNCRPNPTPLAAECKGRGRNDATPRVKLRSRDDDSLRKLEEERKRLEMENEEIKRQVEKLKQQELLMEQEAAKQGYSGKSLTLRELTGREDGFKRIFKHGPGGDSEAIPVDREKIETEMASDVDDSANESHYSSRGSSKHSPVADHHKENSSVIRRGIKPIVSNPSLRAKRTHSNTRESKSSHSHNNKRKRRNSSPVNSRKKSSFSFISRQSRHESPGRELGSKLKYLFKDAKYFLIKSSNHENVSLAQAKGVWSSPPPNETRINQAFRTNSNVILLFSVKESGKFQGFARVAAESDRNHPPIRWVLPVGISSKMLSGVFTLDWINRNELEFEKTFHIRNTYNEGSAVKVGRDGQEIDPIAGEDVCRLFPRDRRTDLNTIAEKSKLALKMRGISIEHHQSRHSSPKQRRSDDFSSRHQNHREREREREKHGGMDTRGWNDRRSRSYERRTERSSQYHQYDRQSSRDHRIHNEPLNNDFGDFHHKMGLSPPIPPGFIPPPAYGHMHPPPPPPPFIFDRFSRGELSRQVMDKRSSRHNEDDFIYQNPRESRRPYYDRQLRDRR